MNPQIPRRVEDPCRTQRHMRRGIRISWEKSREGVGRREGQIRFVTKVQTQDKTRQNKTRRKALLPYPTLLLPPTATEHTVSLGEGHEQATPATSWEQGITTERRPPPAFCAFPLSLPPGIRCWMCVVEVVEAHDAVSHLPFSLTCLEGPVTPPGITALSLARADDDAVCWVHHNHCERDEVVLQACIHDTKHNQYLKRRERRI